MLREFTHPDKVSALKNWPRPSNQKELKCFLGFAGYYQRFVKEYSKIAKPLKHLKSVTTQQRKEERCTSSTVWKVTPTQKFSLEMSGFLNAILPFRH